MLKTLFSSLAEVDLWRGTDGRGFSTARCDNTGESGSSVRSMVTGGVAAALPLLAEAALDTMLCLLAPRSLVVRVGFVRLETEEFRVDERKPKSRFPVLRVTGLGAEMICTSSSSPSESTNKDGSTLSLLKTSMFNKGVRSSILRVAGCR